MNNLIFGKKETPVQPKKKKDITHKKCHLPTDQLKLMKDNHNYKWEQNTLKYLGINLTSNIDSLYSNNYKTPSQHIE